MIILLGLTLSLNEMICQKNKIKSLQHLQLANLMTQFHIHCNSGEAVSDECNVVHQCTELAVIYKPVKCRKPGNADQHCIPRDHSSHLIRHVLYSMNKVKKAKTLARHQSLIRMMRHMYLPQHWMNSPRPQNLSTWRRTGLNHNVTMITSTDIILTHTNCYVP
jgi:hypothetical protein